ncbi:DegV family protein [Amylolactobacillus amylophilus]|uniref:DegV family protein n=1 Tax=Amylolactobacillus amylophilus TaxID=1603 RepID=UPI000B32FA3A|nr:DegV family protein [Amylolactobacillus amylophilus]
MGRNAKLKKAFEHIKRDFAAAIADVDYPVQVTFFDAAAPELKAEWMADFKQSFPNVRILSSIIGPVVGVHVGQGCIALIWSKDIQGFA